MMIDTYLIRTYTEHGMKYVEPLADLITQETSKRVEIIDDRHPDKDFYLDDSHYDKVISLDRHLADCLSVEYFQISRIFDYSGDVVGRIIGNCSLQHMHEGFTKGIRIIDTDYVTGETMTMAHMLLSNHFIPANTRVKTVLRDNEELIDIEDLLYELSFVRSSAQSEIHTCSYMINWNFFEKRTSLPYQIFNKVKILLDLGFGPYAV